MRGQPWTAGQGGRGVGGATLPSLGELKVWLLLLGPQLKTSRTRRSEADAAYLQRSKEFDRTILTTASPAMRFATKI